ncbi:hypothetical protein GCM10018952_74390 [Streptosporangium vulgare]
MAFTQDGKTLSSGHRDYAVRLWDVASGRGRQPSSPATKDHVTSLAFTSDGQTLASGGSDGRVRLWDC